MAEGGSRSFTWLLLAIVSFVIAVLSITGAGGLLAKTPGARWVFGIVFIGIGILWVVRYSRPTPKK
jgi:hypothetical protein